MSIRRDFIESANHQHRRQQVLDRVNMILESIQDDDAMAGWTQTGGPATPDTQGQPLATEEQLRRASRRAFLRDPHGKAAIRNPVKFILGRGTLVDFSETDRAKLKILRKWWKKASKSLKWFRFCREFITRLFRDGEVFVRRFDPDPNAKVPVSRLRFIDPEKVSDIFTDAKDVETITGYKIYEEEQQVEPEDVIHCKMNVDNNVKRGRPNLESVLPYLAKYGKWADARMVLNIVRTSIAIVQEVNGPSTDLFRLRSAQASTSGRTHETDKAKMLRPGTILRGTPGVKYSMLSPNLDAKDAATDGRNFLLAVASGVGFPDAFITADYQNVNFASMTVAQNPAVRECEDWQSFIREPLEDIVGWILEDGIEAGEISQDTDLDCDLSFPPIISREIGTETTANDLMYQARVLSKRSYQLRAGLNPDDEEENMETEDPPVQVQKKSDTQGVPKIPGEQGPRKQVTGSETVEKPTVEKQAEIVLVKGHGTLVKQKKVLVTYQTKEENNDLSGVADGGVQAERETLRTGDGAA
jgi:hypothetical protein